MLLRAHPKRSNSLAGLVGTLAVLCLSLFMFTTGPARAADLSQRIVVMISVDGLAGFYLDDPKAEMPNIRALAAAGARSSLMKASTPTVTWPNHTTLVTGVTPARHGVLANNYFDRASRKRVRLIADPIFEKQQIVKTPTIYDLAKERGLKTMALRWPATRNAKTLDWTIPDMSAGNPMLTNTSPAVLQACARAAIPFGNAKGGRPADYSDEIFTRIFNLLLQEQRPNLALLHLLDVDHVQHSKGPRTPDAYASIKEADSRIGEVWNELKRDFAGTATLLVVSDHGFSPIRRLLLPGVVLRKEGLMSASTNSPVELVGQGGASLVYVVDNKNRKELVARIRRALTGFDGISKILGVENYRQYGVATPETDPRAPDLILLAEEGATFSDTADGDLPFIEKPERGGTHGHDAELPDLRGVFVAWGAGIKPGVDLGEFANIDVAPTVARLLGFSIPQAEGRPLAAALSGD